MAGGRRRVRSPPPWPWSSPSTPARPGCAAFALDEDGHAGGLRLPGVPPALPPPGLGRARPRRHLGRGHAPRWPSWWPASTARRWRRWASPTSGRHGGRGTGRTGRPAARAIVWQDRRTAARCDALREAGHLDLVREHDRAGARPVLHRHQAGVAAHRGRGRGRPRPGLGHGRQLGAVEPDRRPRRRRARHRRRPTPAGRCSTTSAHWPGRTSWPTCSACRRRRCPRCASSGGRSARWRPATAAARRRAGRRHRRRPAGGPVRPGLPGAGHDQEHLRHRQLRAHERGRRCPPPVEGLLTTVALDAGGEPGATYALEGAIFVTGAAVQWLRDGLGIISAAAEVGPLAAIGARHRRGRTSCRRSPGWAARGGTPTPAGTLVGITRGTGRAHLARAVVEAMAYQTRDVVDAMTAAGGPRPSPSCGSTAAPRPPTCCSSSRPTSWACRCRGPWSRRRRRSAPPTWPAWPRACGRRRGGGGALAAGRALSSPPPTGGRRRRLRGLAAGGRALPGLGARRRPERRRRSGRAAQAGGTRRGRAWPGSGVVAAPGWRASSSRHAGVDHPGQGGELAPLPGPVGHAVPAEDEGQAGSTAAAPTRRRSARRSGGPGPRPRRPGCRARKASSHPERLGSATSTAAARRRRRDRRGHGAAGGVGAS